MAGCRDLTQEEVKRMLAAFTGAKAGRNRCLFALGILTGFRISELCALTLADVLDNGMVRNQLSVARRIMKGKTAARTVPLGPLARGYIGTLAAQRNAEGFFRPEAPLLGISRMGAYQAIAACARRLGLPGKIGTHTMRKTFAARVYQDCLDRVARGERIDPLLETSRALGHASVSNTLLYLPQRRELTESLILNMETILQ